MEVGKFVSCLIRLVEWGDLTLDINIFKSLVGYKCQEAFFVLFFLLVTLEKEQKTKPKKIF